MLNVVPSSSLYRSIGGIFLFLSSGGGGGQNGGGAAAVAVAFTAVAGIAVFAAIAYTRR
ncbi:hypothetical protein SOVF_127720 isoform C [Spinacia oleracea]|nr:hypothetical protein SOVF_127720 isoform C [Spinacia oleracea]